MISQEEIHILKSRFRDFLDGKGYKPTFVRMKMIETVCFMNGAFSIYDLLQKMEERKARISTTSGHSNIKLIFLFGAVSKTVFNHPVDGLVWRYIGTVEKVLEEELQSA